MKKLKILFIYALIGITVISCWRNDHNINITYSEDDHYYSMDAHFPKSRTRDVGEYMDSRIGRKSNLSLMNIEADATFTLDDHTIFYMKKYPGALEIKLNKDENSSESYQEIKLMCQGIKKVLAK